MSSISEFSKSFYHISVPQSLRVYHSGITIDQTEHVWICLHGYGQLSRFFARKFKSIEDRVHLVFPEGMHRFYLEGTDGRVGASWMSKENRLIDIANQAEYLDAVYSNILNIKNKKVTVIGFSQGAATASRWVFGTKKHIDHLILWSSAFPPDLTTLDIHAATKDLGVYQVIGLSDPFITGRETAVVTQLDAPDGIDVETITFDGAHEIRPAELKFLADRILREKASR